MALIHQAIVKDKQPVLFSAIGSIGDRLDSKFITAYFFPAFVAVLVTIALFIRAAVGEPFVAWVAQLDSTGQAVAVLFSLLTTMMVAHMLRAMARPIAQLFAGRAFPELIKQPTIRNQLRARARTRIGLAMLTQGERLHPLDPEETQPTAFGNVLAAAADYPRLVYGMDSYHWWPRLLPLLPAEFQELLRSIETPMRAMLNLSLVSLYLGCLAAITLGLASSQLYIAVICLVAGLLCAQFFYRAAVVQAAELARNIWVGFDLYRYDILEQLHEQEPGDLNEERELWQRLTRRLRDEYEPSTLSPETPSETPVPASNARVAS